MSKVFYRIHYFEYDKRLVARGAWTLGDAERFLRRLGYKYYDGSWIKRPFQRAKIVGFNGIPF
jgi:hypothetical protein